MYSKQVVRQTSELFGRPTALQRLAVTYKMPLAFFFGCLFGLSSAGFEIWWLAWIGLAPLLVLLRGANAKLEATLVGLAFGLGYHSISLSWYLGLAPLSWLGFHEIVGYQVSMLIWLVESFHQSLLIGAFALLVYCLPLRAGFLHNLERPFFPYLIAVPLIWVFLQWMIAPSEIFIGMPINQIAYSQYKQLPLIQMASVGGSGSLDFLIVLVNATLANVILELTRLAKKLGERTDNFSTRFGSGFDLAITLIAVFAICSWGSARVTAINKRIDSATAMIVNSQTPPVSVAVVQGNVTIEEERLNVSKPTDIARRYSSLCANVGSSMLCLPEGAINAAQMQPKCLLSILKNIVYTQKKEVVVGSIETLQNGLANAAVLMSPSKKGRQIYLKQRLVPITEFLPQFIHGDKFPAPIKERIPSTRESFLSANSSQLAKSQWGNVGISIYIELIYPKLIANEVRNGASLLVNVSNLAWFHNASINRQLLAAAVFRSVENERYMVLAANHGISAVIDPTGMINGMSLPGHRGVLLNTIQFLYDKTPFSKMWWL
ncbi:MAG: apolipoprotein N-acyltransferase [Candidatus Melainabacteria bacterium]|nr:apolipoprotein N-acyltransferase [Candidatus Melainabacteria bacterium]